jgi:tetratricopeptide (TPR) repeat protein
MNNKIIMKNNIFAILLTGAILIFGCKKPLDVEPTQSIDESVALKTNSDVQVALVGAYADMGAADLYGGRVYVNTELLGNSNELSWSGTFQGLTQIFNKTIPVDNGFVAGTWLTGYRTINDVNNVLSALAVVNANQANRVEGEAKFIRGTVYFDLVRLFGKAWNDGTPANNPGVPLILTPTKSISPASNVARSSVMQVYDQVIKDLTEAEAKLPVANGFFATKNAATAMLARVYLQKGDYANALQAANRVIISNQQSLNANYADEFPSNPNGPLAIGNTQEDIFMIQVNATQGVNDFSTFFSVYGRGDIGLTNNHVALYEAGDQRLSLIDVNALVSTKFDDAYGNVHISRLAEMYLTRAETNFRLGSAIGATALDDINIIRNRVGLPSLLVVSLANILKERKLELAFEGFALHDAKRLQNNVGALPFTSTKLIYPIPDREIRVNSSLVQNAGY